MSGVPIEPAAGQVYLSPEGRPMLYVRTENRRHANGPGPEHFFIEVKDRTLVQRWLPAAEPLPAEFELVNDQPARSEMERLRRERDALVTVMQRAVSVLPPRVANELRAIYAELTPSEEKLMTDALVREFNGKLERTA